MIVLPGMWIALPARGRHLSYHNFAKKGVNRFARLRVVTEEIARHGFDGRMNAKLGENVLYVVTNRHVAHVESRGDRVERLVLREEVEDFPFPAGQGASRATPRPLRTTRHSREVLFEVLELLLIQHKVNDVGPRAVGVMDRDRQHLDPSPTIGGSIDMEPHGLDVLSQFGLTPNRADGRAERASAVVAPAHHPMTRPAHATGCPLSKHNFSSGIEIAQLALAGRHPNRRSQSPHPWRHPVGSAERVLGT
jgi:hypothetical protein